jgi:CHAT domain-containing protein/tetratricopeptide (TPR) repeat protein
MGSVSHEAYVFCGECKTSYPMPVWILVDSRDEPGAYHKCRLGSIHVVGCPRGHWTQLDRPLLMIDRSSAALWYSPSPSADAECARQDLRELLAIGASALPWKGIERTLNALKIVPRHLLGVAIAGTSGANLEILRTLFERTSIPVVPGNCDEQAEWCLQALTLFDKELAPMLWATFKGRLAAAARLQVSTGASKAIEISEEVLAEVLSHNEPIRVAVARLNLGIDCSYRGYAADLERGAELLEMAMLVLTPGNHPYLYAEACNNLAINLFKGTSTHRQKNLDRIIACLESGLSVLGPRATSRLWGSMQQHLGIAYYQRQSGYRATNLEYSIGAYRRALAVRAVQDAPMERVLTLMDLGTSLLERLEGDLAHNIETAIVTYVEALEIAAQNGMHKEWARLKYDLSKAYLTRAVGNQVDNARTALQAARSSLSVLSSDSDSEDWARAQVHLGNAYRQLARLLGEPLGALAIDVYSSALGVLSRDESPTDWLNAAASLSNALREAPDNVAPEYRRGSLQFLEEAASIDAALVHPRAYVRVLVDLGTAYRDGGQECHDGETKAIRTFRRAIDLAREHGLFDELRIPVLRLAGIYSSSGEWNAAYTLLREELPTLTRFYSASASSEGREMTAESIWHLSQLLADACLHLDRPGEAFERWEEGCGRALRDELADLAVRAPDIEADLLNAERTLLAERRELSLMLRRPQFAASNLESVRSRLEGTQLELERRWDAMLRNPESHPYVAFRRGESARIEQVRAWLSQQPGETALVEFLDLHDRWVALTVRPLGPVCVSELGHVEAPVLVQVATSYHRPVLMTGGRADQVAAMRRAVSEAVVRPILGALAGVSTIYVVPYGPLHYLPIHALEWEGVCLADLATVTYSPSASVTMFKSTSHSVQNIGAAVFGNATNDLAYSEVEATVISKMYGVRPVLGDAVTPAALTAALRETAVVHCATHARFATDDVSLSLIQCANGTGVSLEDVFQLEIPQSMVVLSACQSGLQAVQASNSLNGMVRAFFYAGARSVIGTLWSVNDLATMLLMAQFHARLHNGDPAPVALRAAQEWLREATAGELVHWHHGSLSGLGNVKYSVLEEPLARFRRRMAAYPAEARPFEDPYYWAAFVLFE